MLQHLKGRIQLNSGPDECRPPEALPLSIHNFVCDALGISHELAKHAWVVFREYVWMSENQVDDERQYAHLFVQYGTKYEIGK